MTPIWAQMMLLRLESVCAWVWRAERACVRKFQMRVCCCWKLSMLYFRKFTMISTQSDSIRLNYACCLFWQNMKVIRAVIFNICLFENHNMNMLLGGNCRFLLLPVRSLYSVQLFIQTFVDFKIQHKPRVNAVVPEYDTNHDGPKPPALQWNAFRSWLNCNR